METIQQILYVGVTVEIDIGVWVIVARQELLDAQRTQRMTRADENNISDPARDQLQPAENESSY